MSESGPARRATIPRGMLRPRGTCPAKAACAEETDMRCIQASRASARCAAGCRVPACRMQCAGPCGATLRRHTGNAASADCVLVRPCRLPREAIETAAHVLPRRPRIPARRACAGASPIRPLAPTSRSGHVLAAIPRPSRSARWPRGARRHQCSPRLCGPRIPKGARRPRGRFWSSTRA